MELNKFRAGFDFLEMRGEIEGGEVGTTFKNESLEAQHQSPSKGFEV